MSSVFLGLLYVVLETFLEFGFSDQRIKYMLGQEFTENIKLLKRFRNSVFHSSKIDDTRQIELLKMSGKVLPWAYGLTDEFERYFYFVPEINGITPRYGDIIRSELCKINLWLPSSSPLILRKKKVQKVIADLRKYEKMEDSRRKDFSELLMNFHKAIASIPDSFFEPLVGKFPANYFYEEFLNIDHYKTEISKMY
ncbi:MAG: hypothetical protein NT163_04825 [Chlorobiales bacterium]|nr:hypothetical protein [Chlorobiales bacterium]